jgi:hypothetical protein
MRQGLSVLEYDSNSNKEDPSTTSLGQGGLVDGGATAGREAPVLVIHSQPDDYSEPLSGNHPGLTIISTPQGHFVYWKGLEPSESLEFDSHLVAQSTLWRIDPGSWKIRLLHSTLSHVTTSTLQRRPRLLDSCHSHDCFDKSAAPMTTSTTHLD